jgi:hypothetical protein
MIALTFAIAVPLFAARGGTPHLGGVIPLSITATPEDKGLLECSLPRPIGPHRCAYRTAEARWESAPSPHDLVQPFVSTDGIVYLISGLFDDPAVRPHLGPRYATIRFTANCRVRVLDHVSDVGFRFHPTDRWLSPPDPIYAVEALSCSVD